MATAKRSPLEEAPELSTAGLDLADMVMDETDVHARIAGGTATEEDHAVIAQLRKERVGNIMREHQVPRPIAEIIADTGYSKGTANRIYNDRCKRERQAREAAQAAVKASGKAAKMAATA
jgi:hypothetical protein